MFSAELGIGNGNAATIGPNLESAFVGLEVSYQINACNHICIQAERVELLRFGNRSSNEKNFVHNE